MWKGLSYERPSPFSGIPADVKEALRIRASKAIVGLVLLQVFGVASLAYGEINVESNPADLLPKALQSILETEWHANIPVADSHDNYPAAILLQDEIYVPISGGGVACISARNGETLWQHSFVGVDEVSLVPADQYVYVLLDHKEIICLDPRNKTARWRTKIPQLKRLPVSASGVFAFESERDLLTVRDEETGNLLWTREFNGRSGAPLLIHDQKVVVAFETGTILALNHTTGEPAWKQSIETEVMSMSIGHDGMLIATNARQILAVIDLESGRIISEHSLAFSPENLSLTARWGGPILSTGLGTVVFGNSDSRNLAQVNLESKHTSSWDTVTPNLNGYPLLLGNLLVFSTSQNFNFYDLATRLPLRCIETKNGLRYFGIADNGLLIAVPGEGIVRSRVSRDVLYSARPIDELFTWSGLNELAPEFTEHAFVRLVYMTILLSFVFLGSRQVPSNHEAKSLTYMLAGAFFCLNASCMMAGTLLALAYLHGASVSSLAFAGLFATPSLYWIVTIIWLPRIQLLTLHIDPDYVESPDFQDLVLLVNDLKDEMGIKAHIRVRISKHESTTPAIVGSLSSSAILVLPARFLQTVSMCADDDSETAKNLLRFVLAHELAHVKNGDVSLLPIVTALKSGIIVSLIILGVALATVGGSSSFYAALPLMKFLPATWCFALGLAYFTLNKKEELADAVAGLYISPKAQHELLQPKMENDLSACPMELFVFALSSRTAWPSRYLGFAAPRQRTWLFQIILNQLPFAKDEWLGFLNSVRERAESVAMKREVLRTDILCNWTTAILSGIACALVYSFAELVELYTIAATSLTSDTNSLGGLWKDTLVTSGSWGHSWTQRTGASVFRISLPLLTSLIIPMLILLPLRDSPRTPSLQTKIELGGRMVIALLAFMIIFTILKPSIETVDWSSRQAKASTLAIRVLVSFMLIYVATTRRRGRLNKQTTKSLVDSLASLVVAVLACAVVVILFEEISLFSRLLLCSSSLFIASLLNSTWPLNRLVSDSFNSDGQVSTRILFWNRTRVTPDHISASLTLDEISTNLLFGLVRWGIPVILLSLLAYPALIELDAYHMSKVGYIHREYLQSIDSPIPRMSGASAVSSLRSWLLSWMDRFLGPGKNSASSGLLFITLIPLWILLGLGMSARSFVVKKRSLFRLSNLVGVEILESTMGRQILDSETRATRAIQLVGKHQFNQPYVVGIDHRPSVWFSAGLLCFIRRTDGLERNKKALRCWIVKQLADHAIGDSLERTKPPFAVLERAVVSLRSVLGPDHDLIRTWARKARTLLESACNSIRQETASDPLVELTLSDISALSEVAGLDGQIYKVAEQDIKTLASRVDLLWRSSKKSSFETYLCARALARLLGKEAPTLVQLRESWLPSRLKNVEFLNPYKQFAEILNVIAVAYFAMGPREFEENEHICQAIDNIAKAYSHQNSAWKV